MCLVHFDQIWINLRFDVIGHIQLNTALIEMGFIFCTFIFMLKVILNST